MLLLHCGQQCQIVLLQGCYYVLERIFQLEETESTSQESVSAAKDAASGQFDVTEAGRPVLRYNYATIEPGERLNTKGQCLYSGSPCSES